MGSEGAEGGNQQCKTITIYSPGHSNVHTFVFAAIFLTFNSIVKRSKTKISNRQKMNPQKCMKNIQSFLGAFWVTKMGTLKTIRAFMYLEKSVPVKEKGRKRQKKRDSDTQRAHDCPKRHANCGPSSTVSIPTLDDSFAQVYVAQIAQIQILYHFPFWRSFWSGAWRRFGHIEL